MGGGLDKEGNIKNTDAFLMDESQRMYLMKASHGSLEQDSMLLTL